MPQNVLVRLRILAAVAVSLVFILTAGSRSMAAQTGPILSTED